MAVSKKDIVQGKYDEILKAVTEGENISYAISCCGFSRATFYRNVTDIQKQEILQAKTANAQYGGGFNGKF
jgi:hypothetical protein